LFSYLTLNAGTQWAFNNSPYQFLASGYIAGVPGTSGASRIALNEILAGQTAGYSQPSHDLMLNLKNNLKDNAPQFIMSLIGLAVGKRLLTASGIPRSFNRTVRQVGLGSLVKM
tara:strand:- start:257 stop:598 length:342 start_codon:yes stop_codon:yes gene_type:complete